MERVLVECDRAAAGFDADPVHDLRVALRRCRSLADGMIALDPDSSWKDMKKAGKKLFQALGNLRDMQVLEEWVDKLFTSDADEDPAAAKLLAHIHARQTECKQLAFKDLDLFDRKQWRQWARNLPRRAARVRPGSTVYVHLALEKWTEAYDLHRHALRTRSHVSWHRLRIGIKHFRYTVENFLPRLHAEWGDDLKELQDVLGEVHDLDVLWTTALEIQAFPDAASRSRWREKLNAERGKRIARYRAKMVGRQSLWQAWRAELPQGPQLRSAAMSRLRVWAGYLDPDFAHSERVARLALNLYDGLKSAGLIAASASASEIDTRAVLQAAAFMHDVGKVKRDESHHKKSYRMIRGLTPPLGWNARELELAAVVARYHRGALPRPAKKSLQQLALPDRGVAVELAGVLRLANALDTHDEQRTANGKTDGKTLPLEVSLEDRLVIVRAAGYSALDRSAEDIAGARHLLETVLRRPVLVRALRIATTGRPARLGR
jgi:CHAD domain-containing protein